MAGWSHENGMSNNAVSAYNSGLVSASKIKGIPAKLVQQYCDALEWHHTAKFYNETNFYHPGVVAVNFGLIPEPEDQEIDGYAAEFMPEAAEALKEWKENKKKKPTVTVWEGCRVEWLEWGGTRKHPRATEMVRENCRVEIKKGLSTYTIYYQDTYGEKAFDRVMQKRKGTNGFSIRATDGARIE